MLCPRIPRAARIAIALLMILACDKSVTVKCYNGASNLPLKMRKSLLRKGERWCAVEVSNL